MEKQARCTVRKLPPGRVLTNNALALWSAHKTIHGFIEVDVTKARDRMRRLHEATGERLSLTAFIIHCFAIAVSREPRLNSVVKRGRLYTFDTVNVATMVERELEGEKVVSGVTIRNAESKDVRTIHAEIRRAQTAPMKAGGDVERMRWLEWLPGWLVRLVIRIFFSRPSTVHHMGGVTGVTSIGMFSSGIGWGLPITPNTVMLTVGGIGARTALEDGRPVEREVLCLTVSFDHEVVDGAPAARFTGRLQALLSDADGLDLEQAPTPPASAKLP